MTRLVRVDTKKWPDRPHWRFRAFWLGEDDHGVWLYGPAPTRARRGVEPPTVIEHPFVMLVPPGRWWQAEFYGAGARYAIYGNVGTPTTWSGDRVTTIDLDLDVVTYPDRTVEVIDEDEFLAHQRAFAYPEHVVATARATAAWLTLAMERGAEPFATVGHGWLRAAMDA